MDEPAESESNGHSGRRLALTSLTALGVVFGDIGTSPLYAFRLCFSEGSGIAPHPENIMGILSLVFWAITIVITIDRSNTQTQATSQAPQKRELPPASHPQYEKRPATIKPTTLHLLVLHVWASQCFMLILSKKKP